MSLQFSPRRGNPQTSLCSQVEQVFFAVDRPLLVFFKHARTLMTPGSGWRPLLFLSRAHLSPRKLETDLLVLPVVCCLSSPGLYLCSKGSKYLKIRQSTLNPLNTEILTRISKFNLVQSKLSSGVDWDSRPQSCGWLCAGQQVVELLTVSEDRPGWGPRAPL